VLADASPVRQKQAQVEKLNSATTRINAQESYLSPEGATSTHLGQYSREPDRFPAEFIIEDPY